MMPSSFPQWSVVSNRAGLSAIDSNTGTRSGPERLSSSQCERGARQACRCRPDATLGGLHEGSSTPTTTLLAIGPRLIRAALLRRKPPQHPLPVRCEAVCCFLSRSIAAISSLRPCELRKHSSDRRLDGGILLCACI